MYRSPRAASSGLDVAGMSGVLSEPLLDAPAAAALLNVRVSWVRDAARLGHLPCLRVGRHLRFTRVMLEGGWSSSSWSGQSGTSGRLRSPAMLRPAGRCVVRIGRGVLRGLCWRVWLRFQRTERVVDDA